MATIKELKEPEGREESLRPKTFDDYLGQEAVKRNLQIEVEAARMRGGGLDHIILYGPPGLGKTTLAGIVANEMKSRLRIMTGPAIARASDLYPALLNLERSDVLFLDEIHRMPRAVEEILYPVMEDFILDMVLHQQSVRYSLPLFTLIGATTRYAMLSAPLRDRFGIVARLNYYNEEEISQIIMRSAKVLLTEVEEEGVLEIAKRSRGTPRIANRILRRVRSYADVLTDGVITGEVARQALSGLGLDELGLDEIDHKILKSIIHTFSGGPVGLGTIAAAISDDQDTIMDVYEPYLIQRGLLARTPRGRVATPAAYKHMEGR
jgi:holliday junction DNA helicase RuvB